MNIRVQGPDDVIIEFPAGTDNAVISSVMQKRYGGPQAQTPQALPGQMQDLSAEGVQFGAAGEAAKPSEMSYGEQISNAFGAIGRGADNAVRLGANAATLGLADRFAGFAGGEGYAVEKAKTEAARQAAGPVASGAIDIAGSMLPAGAAMKAGSAALGAVPRLAGMMPGGAVGSILGSGAAGAGLGAAESAINDRNMAQGALVGGTGGAAGAALGAGIAGTAKGIGGMFRSRPDIPTSEALKEAAAKAYQRADDAGVMYSSDAVKDLAGRIEQKFAQFGYDPALQPGAGVAFRRIQEDAAKDLPVTLKGIDVLRRVAGNAYQPGNKSNNALVKGVVSEIDDLVASGRGAISGDAPGAASALREARDFYSRAAKDDKVTNALKAAEERAARTGSGGNIENATRQEINKLLKDPSFTVDEKEVIRSAVMGSKMQDALRLAGKLSPSGNGLMAAMGIGATAVNPLMAIPSIVGMGAKAASDKMTRNTVQSIGELIRSGGTKEAAYGQPTGLERLSVDNREALIRLLASAGIVAAPKATMPNQ